MNYSSSFCSPSLLSAERYTLCLCAAGGLFWLWFYDWRLWARSRFCHCVYISKIAVGKLKLTLFNWGLIERNGNFEVCIEWPRRCALWGKHFSFCDEAFEKLNSGMFEDALSSWRPCLKSETLPVRRKICSDEEKEFIQRDDWYMDL
jgi:hypothetical protein